MDFLDGIKLSHPQELREAGQDLEEIARRGATVFLEMIFRDGLYHADPHPGNLFVRPLPLPGEAPSAPGDPVSAPPGGEARPFAIVFVDFGMMAQIPERLRAVP